MIVFLCYYTNGGHIIENIKLTKRLTVGVIDFIDGDWRRGAVRYAEIDNLAFGRFVKLYGEENGCIRLREEVEGLKEL